VVLFGSEQYHAADFREAQGGAHVQSGENGFDGHRVGLKFYQQGAEQGVYVVKYRGG
jgi:hypothetical protein